MSQTKQPTLDLASFFVTLKRYPLRWMIPAAVIAGLAAAYAFLRTPKFEASQALVVRDEAAGGVHRPGRFDSVDWMQTVQETVLELAKSRSVVEAALRQVDPANSEKPSDGEIGKVQDVIEVTAPKGAEFGRTEVFYLKVRDPNPQRAAVLTQAVCQQLDVRLRKLRGSKAQSLIDELTNTVALARTDLDEATEQLSQLEQQVGSDLAELRILNESAAGESNLRQTLIDVKKELGAARVTQRVNQHLLAMLRASQGSPHALLAVPSQLLETKPALQQIKNGLVAVQLQTAQLLGERTLDHPKVQAAMATEREMQRHLQSELTRSISAIEAELQVGEARMEALSAQYAEIEGRMQTLADLRASYDDRVKEVQKRTEILNESQGRLSDARASQAAAQSASQITLLDGPVASHSPIGPSKSMIVACGIFGGLFTGFGLVLLTVPVVKRDSNPEPAKSQQQTSPVHRPAAVNGHSRGLNLKQALSRIEQLVPSRN